MKRASVRIVGVKPLLMHSPAGMRPSAGEVKEATIIPSPGDEAKQGLYLDADGRPCIPADCVRAFLRESVNRKGLKLKGTRIAAGWTVFALVEITPDRIPLEADGYTVDVRRVVLGTGKSKKGIVRARPRFDAWAARFQIEWNQADMPASVEQLRAAVEYGAKYVGLLDFRPVYGRFRVESWEVEDFLKASRLGVARLGKAWPGKSGCGSAWPGFGEARQGLRFEARWGAAGYGSVWRGQVRQG